MSTKAERAFRAERHIMPIKLPIVQPDGTVKYQWIDADVREDKRTGKRKSK